MIASGQDIVGVTQNSQYVEDEQIDELAGMQKLQIEALRLFDASKTHFPKIGALAKPQGDSLYIFIDDSLRGVRSRLYYSSESGLATFSEVKYKFAVWRNIEYDSVNIVVDVNFTLFNPSDDMLKSLYRLQLFEVKFFVQKIESNLLVTHFILKQTRSPVLRQPMRLGIMQIVFCNTSSNPWISIRMNQGPCRKNFAFVMVNPLHVELLFILTIPAILSANFVMVLL
jgi:hypothetical protein